MGSGDAASFFDRYDESVPYFREAREHARKALDDAGDNAERRREIEGVLQELEKRLAIDEPQLASSGRPPSSPPDLPLRSD
jgi:hypothetical protein